MVLLQLKSQFLDRLTPLYDAEEVARFFELLLNAFESKKRIDLVLNPQLETQLLHRWNQAMEALERFEPIQYIIGETEFYGLPFDVTPATLIPRPETEELVEWILMDVGLTSLSILDVGSGSGCIPITLAKQLPQAQVISIDVSTEALAVATRNAERNGVNVQFIPQSVLETEALERCFTNQFFDVIVSNPPYVRHLEKQEIQPNVLEHEPHLALFVEDDDALLFYLHIGQFALNHLKKGGKLYFEINQYLGNETIALVESLGFQNIVLRKDLFGNDRMLRCER